MEKYIQFIKDWFQQLNAVQKRQFAMLCTAVFAVFLTISVFISMHNPEKEDTSRGPESISITAPIPPEDLFLPDEPDYIPGVLLEREQKIAWTAQDAKEHWQDPLKYGEEEWRQKIEASIDEILERVP